MMCAAQVGSYTGYVVLPFTTGVLIDEVGLEPTAVGILGSIELAWMAATVLTMAPRVPRLRLGRVALLGAAVAMAAHGLAAFATTFLGFALLRLGAGFGEGLLAAVSGPLLARAATPERMSAMVAMLGALIYAVVLALVPVALESGGRRGVFLFLAAFVLCLVPFLLRIPREPSASTTPGDRVSRFPIEAPVLSLLAGGVLIGISEAGVWSLDQRFAARVGMSEQELGVVLGLAGILSLAGAGLVAWLGTRFGRTGPLVAGVAILGTSHCVTVTASSPEILIASLCVESFILFMLLPMIYGTAVVLDGAGRVATAFGGAMLVGRALGPGVAGGLLDGGSVELLATAVVALAAAALVAFAFAAHRATVSIELES